MDDDSLTFLQGTPIFGGIEHKMLNLIIASSPVISINQGDYFFRENDLADCMFILQQGKVEVLKAWYDKEYHLSYLYPGDCFGEMALIDFSPRSASVLAVNDCLALQLSTSCINEIHNIDIKQFTILQMNMGREVSRRLRKVDEQLFRAKMEEKLVKKIIFYSI